MIKKKCLEEFQNFKEKEKTLTSFQREEKNYLKRKMDLTSQRQVICYPETINQQKTTYRILKSENYSLIIPFLVKTLIPDKEKRKICVDMLPYVKYNISQLNSKTVSGKNLKRWKGKGGTSGGGKGWILYFIYI